MPIVTRRRPNVTSEPRVLAVGAAAGGVADTFPGTASALRERGYSVSAIALEERGSALAGAWRAAWRVRASLLSHDSLLMEFGSNDLTVFWLAVVVMTFRKDVVLIIHDPPKVAHAPGAAIVARRGTWRMRLAYRVLSPMLDTVLVGFVLGRAGAVVVLSEQARTELQARTRRPVLAAPHGLATWDTQGSPPSECRYVLFAGFLGPSKGVDVLIDAWSSLEDRSFQLLIAGGAGEAHTAWAADLQSFSERFSNPPNWLGSVPEEEAFNLLFANAALVVLPYRASSPASGILVRAMAAGRCIIASRVPACVEAIRDGEDGVLVDVGDPASLASAMQKLLADPKERNRLGRAAADRAASIFGWDKYGEVVDSAVRCVAR